MTHEPIEDFEPECDGGGYTPITIGEFEQWAGDFIDDFYAPGVIDTIGRIVDEKGYYTLEDLIKVSNDYDITGVLVDELGEDWRDHFDEDGLISDLQLLIDASYPFVTVQTLGTADGFGEVLGKHLTRPVK